MSFTCVFLPFYIKVYYCEMFGFFLAFFGGVFGFFMFWQSGNPGSAIYGAPPFTGHPHIALSSH